MNIMGILDVVALSVSSLAVRKSRYFQDDINSVSIAEHLQGIKLSIPQLSGEGFYECKAETLVGELEPAFKIAQWKGNEYPTIIYHHGASEEPFDFSFNKIFPLKKIDIDANLIAIRAPFCKTLKEFLGGVQSLNRYVAMLAVSTKMVEELIKSSQVKITIVTGVSLGGFVTNIHHTFYNTAEYYKPMLAGAEIGEALLNSTYTKMIAPIAQKNSKMISQVLNFSHDFAKTDQSNVYPLLGRYDQVAKLDVQRKGYSKEQLTIINKGHLTGSTSFKVLRQHILKDVI
ncbi:MAG: hypothetical protein R6V14_07535 [Halanaerobiales bacterium]